MTEKQTEKQTPPLVAGENEVLGLEDWKLRNVVISSESTEKMMGTFFPPVAGKNVVPDLEEWKNRVAVKSSGKTGKMMEYT